MIHSLGPYCESLMILGWVEKSTRRGILPEHDRNSDTIFARHMHGSLLWLLAVLSGFLKPLHGLYVTLSPHKIVLRCGSHRHRWCSVGIENRK